LIRACAPTRYAPMSLMMTSAQGSRNQMRPSKMLLTKKLVGMKTTCGSAFVSTIAPCLQWFELEHCPAGVPLATTPTLSRAGQSTTRDHRFELDSITEVL